MGLVQQTRALAAASRADTTRKKYNHYWEEFVAWCRQARYRYLPADPMHVAMFLTVVTSKATSYATVKLASAAIFAEHELAAAGPNPTKHQLCKSVRQGAKRKLGAMVKNRKAPLSVDTLIALVELLAPEPAPLWALTLAAMAGLSFAAFLRYDDVSRILLKDVRIFSDHAAVFLSKRKNAQFREGHVVVFARGRSAACPVRLLERLLGAKAWSPDEPLFQGFDGHATRKGTGDVKMSGSPIKYTQARHYITMFLAKALGWSLTDTQKAFGLHSLRSGGATKAAAEGVCERVFQAHGGWRSREAMMVYLEDPLDTKLAVSKSLGY